MQSMIGQEIDGYRVLEELGRGGMGVVYKALDIALDKTVALKMMDPGQAQDEGFMRRFRSEARALARLKDPRIVEVYPLRGDEANSFIVMEYVDGHDSSERPGRYPTVSVSPGRRPASHVGVETQL